MSFHLTALIICTVKGLGPQEFRHASTHFHPFYFLASQEITAAKNSLNRTVQYVDKSFAE
jgi:hypothetical protein